MPEDYRHLTDAERCRIHAPRKSGLSDAAIARQLGQDRTTVWREVRRNSRKRGYRHGQAQGKAEARLQLPRPDALETEKANGMKTMHVREVVATAQDRCGHGQERRSTRYSSPTSRPG